ncbi:MAG: response regulator [Chloroflexota bacterium]|nr:response regulator [Chloroflexota bacterium]
MPEYDPAQDKYSPLQTILVVEDDESVGMFLVEAISQETSYCALLVSDGLQALRAVENIKPGLFILDYQLPNMNGIELYDRLHAMQGLEATPALMMSARLPAHELERRHITGMRKPLDLDHLLHTIERLLAL